MSDVDATVSSNLCEWAQNFISQSIMKRWCLQAEGCTILSEFWWFTDFMAEKTWAGVKAGHFFVN